MLSGSRESSSWEGNIFFFMLECALEHGFLRCLRYGPTEVKEEERTKNRGLRAKGHRGKRLNDKEFVCILSALHQCALLLW